MLHPAALLTAEESRQADSAAIASGTPANALMENAASAVAGLIGEIYPPRPCLVVCGGGNNGGDGVIVARILQERGWPVEQTTIENFQPSLLQGKGLVVDALFGTGLNKNIEGAAEKAVAAINGHGAPVVAIDIASGVNATTGEIMGVAIRATHTVTFVRPKLGHVLLPGKGYTGTLHVFDIGISGEAVAARHFLNVPALWKSVFPIPNFESHKYTRGHAIVIGGGISSTGAARLAAVSALRAGAGLVSVACAPEALPVYAGALTAVMTKPCKNVSELDALLDDDRVSALLIGPGNGASETTRAQVLHVLSKKKSCVIDADAISSFKGHAKELFSAIEGTAVLTPHEGEFSRLFSIKGDKAARAREAAAKSNAVIILKGNDTVIAAPDGRVAVNAIAPVWLATAGSGDVLAGIVTGLLAQHMPPFEAACAAVWMHSRAAIAFGPGLIAEDLPDYIPSVLKELYADDSN